MGWERGVSSRSAAPCAHPGTGVWLATSTLEVVRFLLTAINILPFPQSFCKKRAGLKNLVSTSSFPSLGWGGGGLGGGGGEPQGAGAGRGGKARAGLRQGMGFSVLMTDCKSPKPQLGDGVTSATWVSLRWLGARSRVLAAVSLAKLLGQTPRGSRRQRGHGTKRPQVGNRSHTTSFSSGKSLFWHSLQQAEIKVFPTAAVICLQVDLILNITQPEPAQRRSWGCYCCRRELLAGCSPTASSCIPYCCHSLGEISFGLGSFRGVGVSSFLLRHGSACPLTPCSTEHLTCNEFAGSQPTPCSWGEGGGHATRVLPPRQGLQPWVNPPESHRAEPVLQGRPQPPRSCPVVCCHNLF